MVNRDHSTVLTGIKKYREYLPKQHKWENLYTLCYKECLIRIYNRTNGNMDNSINREKIKSQLRKLYNIGANILEEIEIYEDVLDKMKKIA